MNNGFFKERHLGELRSKSKSKGVKPIQWLVRDLIPLGILGDIFSMPDTGKSSLILTLVAAIANDEDNWNGFAIANGPVAYIGGEKSSEDVWERDLERANIDITDNTPLYNFDPADGLWFWDRKAEEWVETGAFSGIVARLKEVMPVLVVLDTLSLLAIGSEPTDTNQQVKLANRLHALRTELDTTVLTISHTNQSSNTDRLDKRLHYTSRAGSNGYPGRLRWLMGMTNLTLDEKTALGIDTIRKVIALSVSKHNEMPQPRKGNMYKPFLFEIGHNGNLELLDIDCSAEELTKMKQTAKSQAKTSVITTQTTAKTKKVYRGC